MGKKVRVHFAWYDWWIGAFWDRKKRQLYIMIPFIGIMIQFDKK